MHCGRMNDESHELDHLLITSQRDLHRMWELLMQPLGFRSTSIWVTFVGADDRPTRFLLEIAESETLPEPHQVANLYSVLAEICAEEGEGTSVALLVSRPGRDAVNAFDRDLATRLTAGARRSGVPCHPIHVANDVGVWAVTPDDLAA